MSTSGPHDGRRVLVIDEDLPRLPTELNKRGFLSRRVTYFGLRGTRDPELLPAIAERLTGRPWTLITGDDKMPLAHADVVAAVAATIATIDPRCPDDANLDEWRRNIVHRWAHVMVEQELGTVRRYSDKTHRLWTPLR